MKEIYYYILTIQPQYFYNTDLLLAKLNLAVNWAQIIPNTYIIKSTSHKQIWYGRIKPALGNNRFFLVEIDVHNHTGWLPRWVWNWLRINT